MSGNTRVRSVTVTNPNGLHMRPAGELAEAALRFDSQVELVKDDMRIDGKSVLSIMTLGAEQGSEISLEITGPDAEDAIRTLGAIIEGEPGSNGHAESKEQSG